VNGLEQEYAGRIVFQKLNADEPDGRAALKAYNAPGHPTVILFDEKGRLVWMRTGAMPKEVYLEGVKTVLSGP